MIETTTHYHFSGEFTNLSLFTDDAGDIMIEIGGERQLVLVTPTEARELAELLHDLADEATEDDDGEVALYPVETPLGTYGYTEEEPLTRLQRLLRGHSV